MYKTTKGASLSNLTTQVLRGFHAVSVLMQSLRHIPARSGGAVSPLLHRASVMPLMMSLFVNELMQNLSMSSAKIRWKKAVHCTHNDRLPACPRDVTGQPC